MNILLAPDKFKGSLDASNVCLAIEEALRESDRELDIKSIPMADGGEGTSNMLTEFSNKPIQHFSSGMKQRLKLATAILTDVPFLFLDEPLTNLDDAGTALYTELINKYTNGKTVIICSNNHQDEIFCCNRKINISDYK